MKIKWINRSLILSHYAIGLCQSEDAFKKELRRLKVPKNQWPEWITIGKDAKVHYFEKTDTHALCCIVCIKSVKGIKKSQVIGLLIHEAVHIWGAIVQELNERDPSSEFMAYTIQNIAQRLIEAYYKT